MTTTKHKTTPKTTTKTTTKTTPKANDRDTSRDRAAANLKRDTGLDVDPGNGTGLNPAPDNSADVRAGEGEITQTKQSLGEALAGEASGMEGIGDGSITETAPAVGGTLATESSDRVVQQGDAVVLHTRNPWNDTAENVGRVLKVNQDGTIAVRIPLHRGGTHDFSPVYNAPRNGEDWWSWASDDQAAKLDRDYPAD